MTITEILLFILTATLGGKFLCTETLVVIFISGLLVIFTGYALYTAFGKPSQQLRDPFEEHGD